MCSQMRHRFGAVLCRWSWPLLCVRSSIRSNLNLIPIKTTSSVNQTHCALPSGARHVLHRLARPSLGMTRSLSLLPCHLLARLRLAFATAITRWFAPSIGRIVAIKAHFTLPLSLHYWRMASLAIPLTLPRHRPSSLSTIYPL